MSHPAVCEINECGVLAIGRCKTCNKAFCASHQAYDKFKHITYTNQCVACFADTPEQKELAKRDVHYKEIDEAVDYFKSGAARKDLIKRNVPQDIFYRFDSNYDLKNGKTTNKVVKLAGWYIGKLKWNISKYEVVGDMTHRYESTLQSALPDAEQVTDLLSVETFEDGYKITDCSGRLDSEEWIKAKEAVKNLITKSKKV